MQEHALQLQKWEEEKLQDARNSLCSHFRQSFLSMLDSSKKQGLLPSSDEAFPWEELCKKIYVEAEARPVFSLLGEDTGRIPLRSQMNAFLQASNQRIAVILGNPGSGKTTFSKRWLIECFKMYQDPINQPLPVFISLNQILNKKNIQATQLLEGYFKRRGLTPNQIDLLKGQQSLVVVCDGFDEVSYEGNLYQDNNWQDWSKAKFIITTRPEKFGSALNGSDLQDALVKAFSPSKLKQERAIPTQLLLQELCDFNEKNIQSFIAQWHELVKSNWHEEQYLISLKEIPGLYELTSNPIILSLVLYTLPDIVKAYPPSDLKQKCLQRVTVYDYFVKQWFETQASKVLQKEEMSKSLKSLLRKEKIDIASLLCTYSTQLGYWCLQNNQDGKLKIEIPIQETLKPYLLLDKCREIIGEKMPHEQEQMVTQLLTALRSGCLLKCDSHYFRFFHKSLVQYFAQEHIFKGVVGGLAFEENCEQLNTDIMEPDFLRMLAERVKEDEEFCAFLYEVVRESKKTSDVVRASANAITILNYAKKPLNQESWRGIRIAYADLSGANLHNVDFRETDLSYVNFSRTNLEDANLNGSNLIGCQWGVPERIHFESHVTAVVYPYGDIGLVVGDDSGKIYFIDPQSWSIEKTVKQYFFFSEGSGIRDRGLTVDGDKDHDSRLLASGSHDDIICFWELPSGKYSGQLKQEGWQCLALNSNGQILALGSKDKNIYLWQVNKRERIAILQGHTDGVWSIAWSPDDKLLASGSQDKMVHLWDGSTHQPVATLKGHAGTVCGVAWSPDGKLLASGGWDKTVRLWDGSTPHQPLTTLKERTKINCVAWSPNGKLLASGGSDYTVRLWDESTYQPLATLGGYTSYLSCVVWSPNGKLLIASGSLDNTVLVCSWGRSTHQQLATLQKHTERVHCAAWSPDGKLLASGGSDYTVRLWDESTCQPLVTLQAHAKKVCCVAWASNGKLASGSSDHTVCLWDGSTYQQLVTLKGHTGTVCCVAWSPDGKLLASGSWDKTIGLWDGLTHQQLGILQGRTSGIVCIAWSPDGMLLASGSNDKTVRLWDVLTYRQLAILQGHTGYVNRIAWSPDGILLASGSSDKTVCLWNGLSHQQSAILQGHLSDVTCVVWSSDSKLLVSGSLDQTLRLWEVESRRCLQIISIGFLAEDIKFLNKKLLVAASHANLIHYFSYQRKHGRYILQERTIENSVRNHLNLGKAGGLTSKQHKFLRDQGAVGKPAWFTYTGFSPEELRVEEKSLQALQQIKKNLQNHHAGHTIQVPSLFDPSLTISFHSWAMYLYRITQSKMSGSVGRLSAGNRHAYGLIEGLNQLGCRLLVRIDLVKDTSSPPFALVKAKNVMIESAEEQEGQRGFLRLCQSERQPEAEEIVCFRAGTLNLNELDTLLQKVIEDMQRQLHPKAERIVYRFIGGDDQRDDAHNCLTWLRYLVKEFKYIQIPRGVFDFFAADPQAILPAPSFWQRELPKIDIKNWRQTAKDKKNHLKS